MAIIKPFKGIRYNPELVDIKSVVTPPYDIISKDDQERFYSKDEHNIVRIILGKELDDNETSNKYTRAKGFLTDWLSKKVLISEDRPSIYIYEQEFTIEKEQKNRMGFISLLKLEDFSSGVVVPHEYTYSKPITDRFNLLSTTQANFGVIFLLHSDPKGLIDAELHKETEKEPLYDFVFENGIKNRLWRMDDEEKIEHLQDEMKDKILFIADGHHRYETALTYKNKMGGKGEQPYDYRMMALFNMDNPNLEIFPTHRIVSNLKVDKQEIIEKIEKLFSVESFRGNQKEFFRLLKEKGDKEHSFGLYFGKGEFYFLTLKDEKFALEQSDQTKSADWRKLDVSILHKLILEKLLGIEKVEDHIKYTRSNDEAVEKIDKGEAQLTFLLNTTKLEELKKVTSHKERMPQKSTYFYPKLLTGLVVYKFL